MAKPEPLSREGCDPAQHIWTRRNFLGLAGWGMVLGSLATGTAAFGRFMYPRVLFEPSTILKLGRPEDYAVNTVSERFLREHRLWIARFQDGIVAIFARCTHLGCTPLWLEGENKFKCPCHGSGFRGIDRSQGAPNWTGLSFEGPAPRPLERFKIGLAEDGQIVVDTSKVFRGELDDPAAGWLAPDAILRV